MRGGGVLDTRPAIPGDPNAPATAAVPGAPGALQVVGGDPTGISDIGSPPMATVDTKVARKLDELIFLMQQVLLAVQMLREPIAGPNEPHLQNTEDALDMGDYRPPLS